MTEVAESRRSKRRPQWRSRGIRLLDGIIAITVLSLMLFVWSSTKLPISQAALQARPAAPVIQQLSNQSAIPEVPVASPTATPTDTPTPTPEPLRWQDWTFDWATFTASKAGINQAPITQLQPHELLQKTYLNAQGQEAVYEAIEPETKQSLVWDWTIEGSTLASVTGNASYLYCHDYADGTALCSTIYDVLAPGDTITVETGTEVLTYVLVESFSIRKGEVPSEGRLLRGDGLVLITCHSGGERSWEGETLENSILIFDLASAVQK